MLDTRLDPRQAIIACLEHWRVGLTGCDDPGLRDQIRDIEVVSRMLHAVMLETVAELDSRNLAAATGFGSTKRLLVGMLQLSATEASMRVTHATQLATRRTVSGEMLPPALPNTAAALAAGEIGLGQVRVIAETMAAIPASVSGEQRQAAEADLARYARSFNPASLHKIGRHILAHLDPDGPQPREEPEGAPAAGELRLRERRDGRLGLEGFLEPEQGATFRALIDQFAVPRPAAEHIPDPRTTPQRNADALLEICGLARAAHECPTTAGEPPHLTVTLDWQTLRTGLGSATLDYGTPLSAAAARRWACDAKIIPVVLGGASEPPDVGRALRTVPLSLRRALVARDRGCAFPGCDRPPGLCQAHHCRHWADGGETSIDNCVLLCETHHRHVHHTGWEILIHPGYVAFIPPAIIDPDRTPCTTHSAANRSPPCDPGGDPAFPLHQGPGNPDTDPRRTCGSTRHLPSVLGSALPKYCGNERQPRVISMCDDPLMPAVRRFLRNAWPPVGSDELPSSVRPFVLQGAREILSAVTARHRTAPHQTEDISAVFYRRPRDFDMPSAMSGPE